MTTSTTATRSNQQPAGFPPAPPEAHQRADRETWGKEPLHPHDLIVSLGCLVAFVFLVAMFAFQGT